MFVVFSEIVVNMIILVAVKIQHFMNVNHLDLEPHALQIQLEMLVSGITIRKSVSNLISVKISY